MISTDASFLDSIVCSNCHTKYSLNEKLFLCVKCSKCLFPVYDLEKAKEYITKLSIQQRKRKDLWRYHEIMPVFDNKYRFSLGEGNTPVMPLSFLGCDLHLHNVFLKDEGQNPTGTF